MGKTNKAHTTTLNRLARRYSATVDHGDGPDLQNGELTIEVETTATVSAGIKRLRAMDGSVFVALTNNEGVVEALCKAKRTHVGVMDSHGGIVKQSEPPFEADPA